MKINYEKYLKKYSESSFWQKIKKVAKKLGGEVIYKSLLLYYAAERKDLPLWTKTTILGALGYLITLIDFIPDLTPFLGYSDDLAIISAALVTIMAYVDDEVKEKAGKKYHDLMGEDYRVKDSEN